MHGALRSNLRVTSSLNQQPTGLPGVRITSTTLTIPVGKCCQSQTGLSNVLPPASPTPSESNDPRAPIASFQTLPVAAIVTITIGVALLVLGVTWFLLAYRRRRARGKSMATMHSYAEGYHTVSVFKPDTPPPSRSPSPSTLSSLSTRALIDLGFYGEDDCESLDDGHKQSQPRTPLLVPTSHNRQSVDTLFALRFYYSQELDRRSRGSFLPEPPATPPHQPVASALPASPSPPPPASTQPASRKRTASPKRRSSRRTYLNPAGEPWVRVPPPTAPLPPPPASPTPSHVSAAHRQQQRLSLFPPPQRHPPSLVDLAQSQQTGRQDSHAPQKQQQQQQEHKQHHRHNHPRPAPIKVPPIPVSAPPPPPGTTLTNSTAIPALQTKVPPLAPALVTTPPFPSSRTGGSASGSRFREAFLLSPSPTASPTLPPPPPPPSLRAGRRSLPGWLRGLGLGLGLGVGWRFWWRTPCCCFGQETGGEGGGELKGHGG